MRPFASRRFSLTVLVALLAGLATLWHLEPRVVRLWLNTACLAAGACLIALPVGAIAALIIDKTDAPNRRAAALVLSAILFVPLYLVAGAWDAGFGVQGWHTLSTNPHLAHEPWLRGWRAAIWVHGLSAVPWVVLIVAAGLRAVEAEIEEDAATCAAPVQVLLHVSLPRAASSFVVAGLCIAVVATAEISVTDFFQVRTFAEEVYTQAALGALEAGSEPILSARGLWLGLLLSTALAVGAIAIVGGQLSNYTEAPHRAAWVARLRAWRWPAAAGLWAIVLLVAGVPLGNLIYKAGLRVDVSTGNSNANLAEPQPPRYVRTWSAAKVAERVVAAPAEFRGDLWLSARIGAAAATAALAIALPLAWTLRSVCRVPWLRLTVLALCLTVPGPLLGVGLIQVLNRPAGSPLSLLAWLYDTNFAPWLAQTIRAVPLATLILWPALASVPQAMLDSATTEGCGALNQLFRIALPQRWPAVAAAWLVGLAIAIGELAATVLVIPPQKSSAISVRIFQLLHTGVDDRVAAISLVMVGAIAVLTWISSRLLMTNDE
jgi:iron(III) transport system permease protein